ADQARALQAVSRPPGARAHTRGGRRPPELHRSTHRRGRRERQRRFRGRAGGDPARRRPPLEPAVRRSHERRCGGMTQEIVDAVKMLEQEKGIAADTLMDALQDALLSAYKKTPGAAKYAKVGDQGPAAEAAEAAGEPIPEIEINRPTVDPETGERREAEEPEVELARLEPYMEQIETREVPPEDSARLAAQPARQVILQRTREAERGMMFEEYKDRVGELVTGIMQQSDNRYPLVQPRARGEALLARSEQVYNERYDHGMRVKAVITELAPDTKGPSIVVSRRNSE